MKLGWERFDASLPLSSGLINVAVECLNGCGETWLARAPLALAFKIVAGRRLERAVRRRIARAAHSLRLRHLVAQPTAVAGGDAVDLDALRLRVVRLLLRKIPDAPRRLVGEDLCRRVATLLVACLSEPRLNRELALLLLDYTVSQLADVRL